MGCTFWTLASQGKSLSEAGEEGRDFPSSCAAIRNNWKDANQWHYFILKIYTLPFAQMTGTI